jgi:hypothetical protein
MSKLIIKMISVAIIASISTVASAEYVMSIPLEKSKGGFLPDGSVQFVKAEIPVVDGINPEICKITNDDFISFGGQLLNVSKEQGFECVVSIAVPKAVFDGACNTDANTVNTALWDMMRSKGVDGVMSISYLGECEALPPVEEEAEEEAENPTFDMALTIYISSSDGVVFNGVSVDSLTNAESSHFNMNNDTFFLAKEFASYFWRDGQHLDFIPNVGGLIQFDGKAQDCQIASVSESALGTTYTCSNDINFSTSGETINAIFYRRTN